MPPPTRTHTLRRRTRHRPSHPHGSQIAQLTAVAAALGGSRPSTPAPEAGTASSFSSRGTTHIQGAVLPVALIAVLEHHEQVHTWSGTRRKHDNTRTQHREGGALGDDCRHRPYGPTRRLQRWSFVGSRFS